MAAQRAGYRTAELGACAGGTGRRPPENVVDRGSILGYRSTMDVQPPEPDEVHAAAVAAPAPERQWRWEVTASAGVRMAPTIDPRAYGSNGDVTNEGFVVSGGVDPEFGLELGGHVGRLRTALVVRAVTDGSWSASPQVGLALGDGPFTLGLTVGPGVQQVVGMGFIPSLLARIAMFAPRTSAMFCTAVADVDARYRLTAVGRADLLAVVGASSAIAITGVDSAFEAGGWAAGSLTAGVQVEW